LLIWLAEKKAGELSGGLRTRVRSWADRRLAGLKFGCARL